MRTAIEIKQIHILLSVVACMFLSLCVHESRAQVFILTNDQQLRDLANSPEKEIDNTTGISKSKMSLKQAVEQAKSWHSDQIVIAFDEFFRQYRDDKNTERKLTPDMDEYVNCIAKISNYTTKNAGAGLQLSLLSPLELGQAYRNQTGNTGKWAAFKVGMRNAQTGKFSIQMWQQTLWTNNKGATPVKLGAVKAYAFKGKQVDKTKIAVNPDDIRELKNVEYEVLDTAGPENGTIPQQRLRIYGEEDGLKGYDNVLVIQEYGTLVVLYEPLPEQGELDFIEKFLNAGGKVLWMSAPPMLDKGGNNCSAQWQRIFGAKSNYNSANGKAASGKIVKFTGLMKDVEPQTILTDFVVDRIFPVVNENSEVAATCNGEAIGTVRDFPNNGRACFMGCRLRDDQSRSLGYESRNMFEVLNYLGAYPASGTFKNRNDNPSFLSRTGDYFVSSFPNGTTMVVNHYRTHVENWDGNFSRNPEYDAEILKNNPLPTDTIKLYNAAINGHIVSYTGRLSMGFNVKNKRLCSFYGQQCNEITVDGTKYIFSAGKLNDITFGPVNGDLTHYNLYANGAERIEIPVPQTVNGAKATVDGNEISVSVKRGTLVVNLKPEQYGHLVDIHFTNAR